MIIKMNYFYCYSLECKLFNLIELKLVQNQNYGNDGSDGLVEHPKEKIS